MTTLQNDKAMARLDRIAQYLIDTNASTEALLIIELAYNELEYCDFIGGRK
jgi:hypothetical protein